MKGKNCQVINCQVMNLKTVFYKHHMKFMKQQYGFYTEKYKLILDLFMILKYTMEQKIQY